MSRTIADLLKNEIGKRPIWDYRIWAPLSLDDDAEVKIIIDFGKTTMETTECYFLKIAKPKKR
jgi:hypothetical protein